MKQSVSPLEKALAQESLKSPYSKNNSAAQSSSLSKVLKGEIEKPVMNVPGVILDKDEPELKSDDKVETEEYQQASTQSPVAAPVTEDRSVSQPVELSQPATKPAAAVSSASETRPAAAASSEPVKPAARSGHTELPGSGALQIIGILDETYILATSERGLIVIDQHAAHERVLFERILNAREKDGHGTQGLLIPITIDLSRIETLFIEKNTEVFSSVGFDIQPFSENTVMINSIPIGISQDNAGGFIRDLLSTFAESGEISRKINRDTVAMAACKAAVKAHDKLTMGEAKSLLNQMAECDLPFSCPHGRPTIINIGVNELEKRFGRK